MAPSPFLLLMRKIVFIKSFLLVACILHCSALQAQTVHWDKIAASNIKYDYATFRSAEFADSLIGYLLTDELYRTSDGGVTWEKSAPADTVEYSPYQFFVTKTDRPILFQKSNAYITMPFLLTKDNGSWSVRSWEFIQGRTVLEMWDEKNGFLASDGYNFFLPYPSIIGVTHDGGLTFNDSRPSDTLFAYFKLFPRLLSDWSDSLHCILGHQYRFQNALSSLPLLITTDGARSWHTVPVLDSMGQLVKIGGIRVLANTPFVWLDPPDTASASQFYFSKDYGMNWKASKPFPGTLKWITPISEKEFWAIGARPNSDLYDLIMHTIDNGETWSVDSTTAKGYQLSITANIEKHVWLFGTSVDPSDRDAYVFKKEE